METSLRTRHIYLEKLSREAQAAFAGAATDFTDKYLALFHLRSMLKQNPELIDAKIITAIKKLLLSQTYDHQHQGFFIFREAAETLVSFLSLVKDEKLAVSSYDALKDVLERATGNKHRAVAGALGSVPFHIRGPKIELKKVSHIPMIQWPDFLRQQSFDIQDPPVFLGRCLVSRLKHEGELLVLKMARPYDSTWDLQQEVIWMNHLNTYRTSFPLRFDIPTPIQVEGSDVFRVQDLPVTDSIKDHLHPQAYAVGFLAHKEYFCYPNEATADKRLSVIEFQEVIFRNAWLAGNLASRGIIHAALIPLFHNRTQRNRRQDGGVYEWIRAGRLDRWLASCTYPNIGLTGVRDFEHFESFQGLSQQLYRSIGSHLLSLLLVAGSYFRQKNNHRIGYDEHGIPTDTRDLFEEHILQRIIQGIFHNYYEGFVGEPFGGEIPLDFAGIASRMIEEMGVDRHMEEILRVADQKAMSENEFSIFLADRGFVDNEIAIMEKGVQDIVIQSGPHLGGFNGSISLPELIETIGTMSALCMVGRLWKENFTCRAMSDKHPLRGKN